ncbi:MAG TPA: DUF2914 domain-containing protein [Gammaproteobacteria bacterium]
MKILMMFCVVLLGITNMPVYAQGGAQPEVPPPVGGEIPPPAATDDDVLQVPESATEPLAQGSVSRASFTTGIQDREPVDELADATTVHDKIYFFTELKDLDGQTVQHRWRYMGETVAEIDFNVGGSRWRVWSHKTLQPDKLGTWTVEVINGSGKVIATKTLEYKQASATEPEPTVPLAQDSGSTIKL